MHLGCRSLSLASTPAAAGFFVGCATICGLLLDCPRLLSLPSRLFIPLTRCCAWVACACALLVQGCALEERAESVSTAVSAPQVHAVAVAPLAFLKDKKTAPLPAALEEAAGAAASPDEQGKASWYGAALHRRRTASGERFDMHALTAAHRTLPFGTQVCVRSLVNGNTVKVRINDRGPHTANRIIDLSRAAAQSLDMLGRGVKSVALTVLEPGEKNCAPS